MKKKLLFIIIGFLPGLVAGAAIMLLIFPFLFPPPVLNEQINRIDEKSVIASGTFIHPDPSDPIHWGKGNVTIYRGLQTEIFLNPDFAVGPGPDYYVYLSNKKMIRNNDQFETSVKFEVARLKSFEGSQVFLLPDNVSTGDYSSIVIWCKTFGQLITSAELEK